MMKLAILLIIGVIARQVYGDEPEAIVGGNYAQPGQFLYQISLQYKGSHMCGGTIISLTHIVTAAHCIPENKNEWIYLSVVTGATNLLNSGTRHLIKCIRTHSGYNPRSNKIDFDIAVITLRTPIVPNNDQRQIALASKDYSTISGDAVVSGWGKTSANSGTSTMLKWLKARVLTLNQCRNAHGSVISRNQICILENVGQGACQGDSGGPLVSNNELIGVVSWGIPCAHGHPDVFTNVFTFLDWIRESLTMC